MNNILTNLKPWPNYRTKLDSTFQLWAIQHCSTVWRPVLDHVRPTFCSIKCWIEFSFDKKFRPTILLEKQMFQCFASVTSSESQVRHASQSGIAMLLSSVAWFCRHLQQRCQKSKCHSLPFCKTNRLACHFGALFADVRLNNIENF